MNEHSGWYKKVLAEDEYGHHIELDALFFCRSLAEAQRLADKFFASHIRHGDEILKPESLEVYLSDSGKRYVIFDWRKRSEFFLLEVDSQF